MEPDEELEFEVTVTFCVPVSRQEALGPRELATHLRDRWTDEPADLLVVVAEGLGDDYELQVKPFSEP